jgi:hypothetical protein
MQLYKSNYDLYNALHKSEMMIVNEINMLKTIFETPSQVLIELLADFAASY